MNDTSKSWALHGAVFAALFLAQFVVGDYTQLMLTRIMVLAIYATGYNLLFGYAGLLSLGHAMFFGAGLYAAALGVARLGMSPLTAFIFAIICGALSSALIGAVALRAKAVAFMIVTLMFSQAAYLVILYFGEITRGDEGIVLKDEARVFEVLGVTIDLTSAALRYNLAWALLLISVIIVLAIARSRIGHVLVAIRENESRTRMLGYDVQRYKLFAFTVSGTLSAVAGAAYALMFAFAGASLASIQYSINPLLWTLLGGASTVLGPLLGTGLMTLLVDVASSYTDANLLAVGVALIIVVLFFPKGILGALRDKQWRWLP